MICTVTNAYPQNLSVDATAMPTFKYTFYGDKAIGAELRIYDMKTNKLWDNKIYTDYRSSGYYNGEEIDHKNIANISDNNNKDFIWNTRVYQDINLSTGLYPTTKVTSGTIFDNQILEGYIGGVNNSDPTQIFISAGLDIKIPSWIYVGSSKRKIIKYDEDYDTVTVDKAFTNTPTAGTEFKISPFKGVSPFDAENNQVFIATNIDINGSAKDLFHPVESDRKPCFYMRCDEDYVAITAYSKKTGLVTLEGTALPESFEEGNDYSIYSAYVQSPYFYFHTEVMPKITAINFTQTQEVVKCKAIFTGSSSIKYNYWEIYETTGNKNVLVETSEKMYLGKAEYIFRAGIVGHTYIAKCYIVTQSNWEIYEQESFTVSGLSGTNFSSINISYTDNNAIRFIFSLSTTSSNGGIKILRQIVGSDIIEFVHTIEFSQTSSLKYFNDYKCANGVKYNYYFCAFNNTTQYNAYTMQNVSTDYNTYSICMLKEVAYKRYDNDTTTRIDYDYMYGDKQFKVIDVYRPEIEVTMKPEFTQNLGKATYVGYFKTPTVGTWDTSYTSLSLTFQLGNTNLAVSNNSTIYTNLINDGIDYLEKLKKSIESGLPILFKDYKGNVIFGDITGFSYSVDNEIISHRPITVNLSIIETFPIDKIKIVGD